MKKMYTSQPFQVGSKNARSRSLALVIPHEVVKRYGISTSTVIIFRTDCAGNTITLHTIQEQNCERNQENRISDTNEDGFVASSEQRHTSVENY